MKTLALILAALAAPAAFAQPQQSAAAQHSAGSRGPNSRWDPNEMICRSEAEPGSRLRAQRRCATRAQWAEQIRQDRQYAERAQTNRTYCGGICVRRMGHGH